MCPLDKDKCSMHFTTVLSCSDACFLFFMMLTSNIQAEKYLISLTPSRQNTLRELILTFFIFATNEVQPFPVKNGFTMRLNNKF